MPGVPSNHLHHLIQIGIPLPMADPLGDAVRHVFAQQDIPDLI